jgi:hypothetical protein
MDLGIGYVAMRIRVAAAAACLIVGCSGGDLTLPGQGEPSSLVPLSGDDQQAKAGTVLDDPLVVQVLDESSQPFAGVTVEFSFLGEIPGAELEPSTVSTDENGRASAVVRLGSVTGEQLIVARVAGSASPDLSANFRAVATGGKGKGDGGGFSDSEDGD